MDEVAATRRTAAQSRCVTIAWIVVAVTALLRLAVAAKLPLSGDEAYYWEWSRRLAPGYFDHPPMVAWFIALGTLAGKSVAFIRLPFVAAGVAGAVLLAAFTARAAQPDSRTGAGATAALLFSLAPFAIIAFTAALPDGPYLLFWTAALYCALRALRGDGLVWWIALGACVGACILSRILGLALAAGIVLTLVIAFQNSARAGEAMRPRYSGALAALLTCAAVITPYVLWNWSQHWNSIEFALAGRHEDAQGSGIRALALFTGLSVAALSPGLFVIAFPAVRRLLQQRTLPQVLLLCTSIPLLFVCVALTLKERVEIVWASGAFVSLIAAAALYVAAGTKRAAFYGAVVPAAVIAALAFAAGLFPLQLYTFATRVFGTPLRHSGPFEILAFEPAARDIAAEARTRHAWVMTDGYGLSSVLDYYGGIPPVVIGYDRQGSEARRWFDPNAVPTTALFVDKEPLASRPDFHRQFVKACRKVVDEGERSYYFGAVLARTFYVTRCEGLTPSGLAALMFRPAGERATASDGVPARASNSRGAP